MNANPYAGTSERTFQQALIYLLEDQYKVLGSRRVLELLAQDVQQLVEQFYPAPERLSNGWMVFTGTRAQGSKAHVGQGGGEHELVTLSWPVLLPEDLEKLTQQPVTQSVRRQWLQQRMLRILEYGYQQAEGPVLLTVADLSSMMGLTMGQIGEMLRTMRQEIGKPLPTKGYYFDQGMRPSHKAEVIALYERGVDEADIARQMSHAPESVGQYIRDYERVKMSLKHGIAVSEIGLMTGMQPNVVRAYAKLIAQYHPELLPVASTPEPATKNQNGDK